MNDDWSDHWDRRRQPGAGVRAGGRGPYGGDSGSYDSSYDAYGHDPYAGDQLRGGGDPYGADPYGSRGHPRRRVRRRRHPLRAFVVILVVLGLLLIGGYFYLDSQLRRENALPDYKGRPEDTPGTNWLIVGSDSREGLSRRQRKELATGAASGRRTDSMMLLHTGEGGATLVSLPRDSFVEIPGHGSNKLNAAFAFGGPRLLVRTVEQATDIRIDHYAEIGFGGFVGMVDALGGVEICVKESLRDPKAGLNLRRGCQTLSGGQALGYVRTRATVRADLDRVNRQREFFGALVEKAASPGVLLNPFRSVPLAISGTQNFRVDEDDHLLDLMFLMFSMRDITGGEGVTTTVPIGGSGSSLTAGSYITWDRDKARQLFNAIRNDRPIPRSAIDA